MNEIVKQIEELKLQSAYINFKEHLSDTDYERMSEINIKIKELEKQLPDDLVCLHIKTKTISFYLTDDALLCCGTDPTWFDSKEEAFEAFKKADLLADDCELKYIERKEFIK